MICHKKKTSSFAHLTTFRARILYGKLHCARLPQWVHRHWLYVCLSVHLLFCTSSSVWRQCIGNERPMYIFKYMLSCTLNHKDTETHNDVKKKKTIVLNVKYQQCKAMRQQYAENNTFANYSYCYAPFTWTIIRKMINTQENTVCNSNKMLWSKIKTKWDFNMSEMEICFFFAFNWEIAG